MNMHPSTLSEIGRAAVGYARAQRWHVFPAPPGKKQSFEKAVDHDGRRWGATDEADTVTALFAKHPGANVGIATEESGIFVLDLDRKNGADGVAWLEARIAEHGELPDTVETASPTGGWHVYFRYPDFDPKTCEGEIAPGVDVRGHGGMVIAPPSVKPDANETYRWKHPPGLFEVAEAPTWLLDILPRRERLSDRARVDAAPILAEWGNAPADLAEVEELLSYVDPDGGGYDQWREVLMALHDHTGGGGDGLALAEAWSARGAKYRPGEVARKWRSFTSGGGVGMRTIAWLAGKGGADLREIARRYRGQKRTIAGKGAGGIVVGGNDAPPHDDNPDEPGSFDLSHDALACDLGERNFDRDARHVAAWGSWLFWTGSRWEIDQKLAHLTRTRDYLRTRANELADWAERKATEIEAEEGESKGDKLRNWAKEQGRALRNKHTVAAVESLARSNIGSVAAADEFDNDLFLLGTPGGTVDLRTGQMRPAKREDMITKLTACAPAPPGARPQRWLRFLDEVFDGDREIVAFMQRAAGYALTGLTTEHKLLFLYGTGRNGKSVFLDTLMHLFSDYARRVPAVTLLHSHGERHPTDIAGLQGARLAIASELPRGKTWDEATIKDLTGGDRLTARRMRQDFFDFDPQLTLMIAGNNQPSFRGVDEAIRARVVLVPFTVFFPPEKRDTGLKKKLEGEAPAILRWAIDGALAWQERGLDVPASVAAASADYFDDEDTIAQFLDEEAEQIVDAFCCGDALITRFTQWCERQGLHPWTKRTLMKELYGRGFEATKSNGKRGLKGLRLRSSWSDLSGA